MTPKPLLSVLQDSLLGALKSTGTTTTGTTTTTAMTTTTAIRGSDGERKRWHAAMWTLERWLDEELVETQRTVHREHANDQRQRRDQADVEQRQLHQRQSKARVDALHQRQRVLIPLLQRARQMLDEFVLLDGGGGDRGDGGTTMSHPADTAADTTAVETPTTTPTSTTTTIKEATERILQYAERIAITGGAPPHWDGMQPLFLCRPPNPQEEMMRASKLFQIGQNEALLLGDQQTADGETRDVNDLSKDLAERPKQQPLHSVFHVQKAAKHESHEELLDMDLGEDNDDDDVEEL